MMSPAYIQRSRLRTVGSDARIRHMLSAPLTTKDRNNILGYDDKNEIRQPRIAGCKETRVDFKPRHDASRKAAHVISNSSRAQTAFQYGPRSRCIESFVLHSFPFEFRSLSLLISMNFIGSLHLVRMSRQFRLRLLLLNLHVDPHNLGPCAIPVLSLPRK